MFAGIRCVLSNFIDLERDMGELSGSSLAG